MDTETAIFFQERTLLICTIFVCVKYYFIFHRKRTTEVKLLPFDKTYMNNTNLMFHAQIQQQKVFVFPVISLRDRCISRNERLQKQRVNSKKSQEFQNHIQMYSYIILFG